jgi:hypothetical protein
MGSIDQQFELLIQDLILHDLIGQESATKVRRVLERPQRGKDIVVESSGDIRLFGIPVECRSNAGLTIHVECKWTSSPALSFERVASNAAQNRDIGCDAFMVVTNSLFTAGALWDLHTLFRDTNTRLIVIDGPRLGEIAAEAGCADGARFNLAAVVQPEDVMDGIVVRDDMNVRELGSAEITLSLQNRTPEPRSGRLFLQSDTEWILEQAEGELLVHLPPFGVQAFRLNAKREILDRTASLRIGLDLNGALRSFSREYVGRLDFHPGFVGAEHEAALHRLLHAFDGLRKGSASGLLLATVLGPAGTGKSRLVQELEAGLKDVRFRWFRHEFPEPGASTSFDALLHRAATVGFPLGETGEIRDAASLIRSFAHAAVGFGGQIPVLVLEDCHNADGGSCEALIELLRAPLAREKPVCLLLTGRTDHSHGNADFQRLADLVLDFPAGRGAHVTLARFDADVAQGFIGGIIRDAPPQVVDAIERLSGRVPAHIVQCVEWLLDMSAVRVVHRSAVGIIDHQRFISRMDELPRTMVALLADRYDFLAEAAGGEAAQRVLAAAALIGSNPPAALLSLRGPDLEPAVCDLLIGRRFLEPADDAARLRWHHENLLLHFRNWLVGGADPLRREHRGGRTAESWRGWAERGGRLAAAVAAELRERPDLLGGVDPLSLGRLASLAGDHPAAVELWRPMLDELRGIAGYSTADIPAGYHEHLRFAYESVRSLRREPELLPAILKALTYIGGYSLSLANGTAAADFGIDRLRGMRMKEPEKKRLHCWLRCLKAHFLLDAGFVRHSQGLLLELQAELEADCELGDDATLGFEVYNCLGMLYGYLNHAALALRCFAIADLHAEQLGDERLKGKQLADRTVLYQFSDFAAWSRMAGEAEQLNARSGTVRHQRHASVVMLCLQFLLCRGDPGELERIGRELDAMQKSCEAASYFSLMPRFYLLRAAISYALATDNLANARHDERLLGEAQQAADHGLGIGIQRGIGFISWQLRNLKAMIALRRGNHLAARENLFSAFEIMRTDGLLFLGNADLSCPNQVVLANYVKLLHGFGSDREVKVALHEVRTYDTADWTQDNAYEFAVHTSLMHDALLGRQRVGAGLARDEKTGLGLVVWVP